MKKVIFLVIALFVSSCANNYQVQTKPAEMVGAAVGALVGGYMGGQFGGGAANIVFTMLGGAVGAATGYSIASQLMPSDMTEFENSTKLAMDNTTDGDIHSWTNPSTGVAGTIRPIRSYYADQDTYCREFEATIAVNQSIGETSTRACKFAGGPWLLQTNT